MRLVSRTNYETQLGVCVAITIAAAIAFVIAAAPLNFQFGYSSKLDINKSRLRTMNELTGIYKFNAGTSILNL